MANRNRLCDELFAGGKTLPDAAATRAFGKELAAALETGDTLSLEGPLGAGKTCITGGIAEGLGIAPEDVSSPTFTLVHEYHGAGGTLVHFDLYRVGDAAELAAIGFDDYLGADAICVIEWGDRFPEALPSGTLRLRLEIEGNARRITGSISR